MIEDIQVGNKFSIMRVKGQGVFTTVQVGKERKEKKEKTVKDTKGHSKNKKNKEEKEEKKEIVEQA